MSTPSRKPVPKLDKLDAPPFPGVKSFKPIGPLPQTPPTTPLIVSEAAAADTPKIEAAAGGAPVDGLNALPTPAQGVPKLTDAQAYWALARS